MAISTTVIEQIRSRARIEEIVAKYVPSLSKRGSNFIGLCPFHREKTPSFTVSPDKQIYHCFGCHAGGNVFSFIMNMERLEFPDSVRYLGKLYGINVEDDRPSEEDEYFRINDFAMRLYNQYLFSDDGTRGLEYLLERGLTEESIKSFRLGYAPDEWDFLKKALMRKKVPLEKCAEVSLLVKKNKDSGVHYFDFFRNRVIFPIFDRYGKVAGFGGRITGDGEPKYLNSPETRIYRKRDILYGYDRARSEIASLKRAIVVEGYLDVIGCHQVGICNVVAPLGTALTEDQVRLLAKSAEEIVLLFDADSAGLKASLRSINVMKDFNVNVRIAALPQEDPFDYAVKKGARELLIVIDTAMSPADFRISQAVKEIEFKGRRHVLMNLFSMIRDLPLETDKSDYLKKAAEYLETDYISLTSDFRKFSNGQSVKSEPRKEEAYKDFIDVCYRELVILLINFPQLTEKAAIDFAENKPDTMYGRIFSRMVDVYAENEDVSTDRLFDFFTDDEEKKFLASNVITASSNDDPSRSYDEIYVSMRIYLIDRKIEECARAASKQTTFDVLLELEGWKREKEKLETYLNKRRGAAPKSETVFF